MSSYSYSSEEGEEEGGDSAGEEMEGVDPVRSIGEPSSSRQRSGNGVWPEPFVEAMAVRVATDAAAAGGRVAAAPAIAAVFQVCSRWRDVSRSELLWQTLTRQIWSREHHRLPTWREEYARCHRTARNFRTRTCVHTRVPSDPALVCRRLALSHLHLAAGFLDGSVRLFDLPSAHQVAAFDPHPDRDLLGRFSQSIAGLLLLDRSSKLVFASQDGDIHVASTREVSLPPRRAQVGNLVEDGTLVDFAGCGRCWVGLFAGVPGRSLHVWDGETEELMYVGGRLTDSDSVLGWQMLTELYEQVGRVRFVEPGIIMGCTLSRVQIVGLDNLELILRELELRQEAVVGAVDASDGRVMVVDSRGVAKVRRARTLDLEEVCRFSVLRRGGGGNLVGCMNREHAVVCTDGVVRVWDAHTGKYLYNLGQRTGDASAVSVDDRRVGVWTSETGVHLWDFGAL